MEHILERLERVLGVPDMPPGAVTDDVEYWKARVLQLAMVVGVGLGIISVIPGVTRAIVEHNYVLLAADIIVLGVAVAILMGRSLPYRHRAVLLVTAGFGIGLVQVVTSGVNNAGPVWMFAGCVMAAMFFDVTVAMSLACLMLLTFSAQAVLGRSGLLSATLTQEVLSPRWTETVTDTVLLSTVIPLFTGVLLHELRKTFERGQRVSAALETERRRLLRSNQELEEEIERRERAEEERGWLATAMVQAKDAMAIIELDGRIRYVNRSFEELFDRTADTLLGIGIRDLRLFADPESVEECCGVVETQGMWAGRLTACRGDGRWEAQASFSTPYDRHGRPMYRLAVIRDVSREAELEAHLQQAQKLEAIGTFAGGIAHDFNNMLVPILGSADLLKAELTGEPRRRAADIARSALRAKELVAQILAFSRGAERKRTLIRLGDIVEESQGLLRASLPAQVALDLRIEDPGPVHVSETEAQQVVMNLCTNAFHAMRRGPGTLRIEVDSVSGAEVDTRGAVVAAPVEPERAYARLAVVDEGVGMDRTTMERVFEPFFTTKPGGEGTGLGLAMVHSVARGADGTVVIRSEPGVGTRVEVLLPRTSGPIPAEDTETKAAVTGAGQRILVVDDERAVLGITGRFLAKLAYDARLVSEPLQAMRILDSGEPIDALITDLTMPGVSGLELGRAAHEARPALPMILCTGLADSDTLRQAREAGFDEVLAKPFSVDELGAALARVVIGEPS